MRFNLPPISVHYTNGGKLLIGRPAPPEKPKPLTLADLLSERSKLSQILNDKRIDSAVYPVGAKERLAELDSRIEELAGAR